MRRDYSTGCEATAGCNKTQNTYSECLVEPSVVLRHRRPDASRFRQRNVLKVVALYYEKPRRTEYVLQLRVAFCKQSNCHNCKRVYTWLMNSYIEKIMPTYPGNFSESKYKETNKTEPCLCAL